MPDQVQLRGGSANENDSFTGAQREVTVDTTSNTLRVHDGTTTGGHPLAQGSTSTNPDADTLIKRDEWGRAQVADPEADADIANKGWVAGQIADSRVLVQAFPAIEVSVNNTTTSATFVNTDVVGSITPVYADSYIVAIVAGTAYAARDAGSPSDRRGKFRLRNETDDLILTSADNLTFGRHLVATSSAFAINNTGGVLAWGHYQVNSLATRTIRLQFSVMAATDVALVLRGGTDTPTTLWLLEVRNAA